MMILESIVTTANRQGQVNIAPMGPLVDHDLDGNPQFVLRPFDSSITYRNLTETRTAVIHVTDDVHLFARAAVSTVDPNGLILSFRSRWWPLVDCCRWFAVEIETIRQDGPRSEMSCRVIESAEIRPFFGFNRAKHAVIEAAILATRTGILPDQEIRQQLRHLQPWVDKTGGPVEAEAFEFLKQTIDDRISAT